MAQGLAERPMLFYQPHYYTDTHAEPGVQRKTRLGTLFGPAAQGAVQKRVPSRNVICRSEASPHQNGSKPENL
jgi:hypothetical protein